MKTIFTILVFSALPLLLIGQSVGVNTTNPDPSAALDVTSTTGGMLVPRMTSAQRTGISNPAIGLLVYDNETNSFWVNTNSGWEEITAGGGGGIPSEIEDSDGNTQVQTEESGNENVIRFDVDGTERMTLSEDTGDGLLDINGRVNIGTSPQDNTVDFVLVRGATGLVGTRDVSTLTPELTASAKGDTVFIGGTDNWFISPGASNANLETVTDIDGNTYQAIPIGSQTWMIGNLRTTMLNDGTPIPQETDGPTWNGLSTPAYCWYNNQASNADPYGALYNFFAVESGNLCPTGWHVPTAAEWQTLQTFLGGAAVAGGKLKETGTTHWASPNTGATNSTCFNGVGGGIRFFGDFFDLPQYGYYWSSTPVGGDATVYFLAFDNESLSSENDPKESGVSVRCVKD